MLALVEMPLILVSGQVQGPQVQDPNQALLLGRSGAKPSPRRAVIPSATVEVASEARQEEVRAFVHWMAPALRSAARTGEASDESIQMLAEFMTQDPSHPKPPTLPAFWYNAQRPGPFSFGVSGGEMGPKRMVFKP